MLWGVLEVGDEVDEGGVDLSEIGGLRWGVIVVEVDVGGIVGGGGGEEGLVGERLEVGR